MYIPHIDNMDTTLKSISDIEITTTTCATIVIKIFLALLLLRRPFGQEKVSEKVFKAEQGLIVTSLVSYVFYTLYYANGYLARYLKITFCGYAQYLFFGMASMTPFW
ncbi:hypothetical protein PMAYCL1PPCAC_05984, partial [Pristionchus mayeri]